MNYKEHSKGKWFVFLREQNSKLIQELAYLRDKVQGRQAKPNLGWNLLHGQQWGEIQLKVRRIPWRSPNLWLLNQLEEDMIAGLPDQRFERPH